MKVLRFYQELFFYKLKNRLKNVFRFKEIWKEAKNRKQSCNRCGNETYFDFVVKRDFWNLVPLKYRDKILCINCFVKLICKEIKIEDFKEFFIVK